MTRSRPRRVFSGLLTVLLAVSGVIISPPAVACDQTADWYGSGGSWTCDLCWGLTDDCYPDNGNCNVASWCAIVNGGWIDLNVSPTITELTLNGNITSTTAGGLTVMQSLVWTHGDWGTGGTLRAQGSLSMARGDLTNGTLLAEGATVVTTMFYVYAGTTTVNGPDGDWELPGGVSVWGIGFTPPSVFDNQGTFRKTGAGESFVWAEFNNSGELVVEAGLLDLGWGGSSSGLFTIPFGTTLEFSSAHTLQASAVVEGAGTVLVATWNETIDSSAAWDIGHLDFQSGVLNIDQPVLTDSMYFCRGTIGGPASLTIDGTLDWGNGGTMAGPGITFLNGRVNVDNAIACGAGTPCTLDGRTLQLSGNTFTLGDTLNGANGAVVNIPAHGTFEITNVYGALAAAAADATLNNDGTILKTSTTDNSIYWQIVNRGLVHLTGGALKFYSPASYTQSQGETRLDGGDIYSPAAPIVIEGGLLTGAGTITGDVVCSGANPIRIEPGLAGGAGELEVWAGDLTLSPDTTTAFELGGTSPGEYDTVVTPWGTATLSLAGTLEVAFINGFEDLVEQTDEFTLTDTPGTLLGAFANAPSGSEILTSDGHGYFTVHYGAGSAFGEKKVVITGFRPALTDPDCPADANGDGKVGALDFLGLLAHWGPCPPPCPWDIDGNQQVTALDFLDLLAGWGPCPRPANDEWSGATGIDIQAGQDTIVVQFDMSGGTPSPDPIDCINADPPMSTVCGDPGAGDCCSDNWTPGCSDKACCVLVCAADPFCCQTGWDEYCAVGATQLCGELCAGGGVFRDTWLCVNNATDIAKLATISVSDDLELEVRAGCGGPAGPTIACGTGLGGTEPFTIRSGAQVLVRVWDLIGLSDPELQDVEVTIEVGDAVAFYTDEAAFGTAIDEAAYGMRYAWGFTPDYLDDGSMAPIVDLLDGTNHAVNAPGVWFDGKVSVWPPEVDSVTFTANTNPRGPLVIRGLDGLLYRKDVGSAVEDLTANFFPDGFDIIAGAPDADDHTAFALDLRNFGVSGPVPATLHVTVYDPQDAELGRYVLESSGASFLGVLTIRPDVTIGRIDIWDEDGGSEGIHSFEAYVPISGACCMFDTSCLNVPEELCELWGGFFMPGAIDCEDVACFSIPTGACCVGDGTCHEATSIWCSIHMGEYHGDGSACTADFCGCGLGGCCWSHVGPGCEITACCDTVCYLDPYCCDVHWDELCATVAQPFPQCGCGAD